jgi:hypothetical protein
MGGTPTDNTTWVPIDYERQTLQAAAKGKTCKEDNLAHWPHIQVNTLEKISDDYTDTSPLPLFTENTQKICFGPRDSARNPDVVNAKRAGSRCVPIFA